MTKTSLDVSLEELLADIGPLIEADLARWVVEPGTPPELDEAMRYCVLGGGKRLRPALVYLAAEAVGGASGPTARRSQTSGPKTNSQPTDSQATARAAVAIELIHCCSLVHDDLPAMDNDVLRRGRPTAHVKFGEAMAILVGDALLTRAFGVLGEIEGGLVAPLTVELASAAGGAGMTGGQVADMGLCRLMPGLDGLRYIHVRKTAAMVRGAARMGAICGRAGEPRLRAMGEYGEALGLAFQVYDDLLDATADAKSLGKTPGKDAASGKRTYVAEIGLEKTRAMSDELTRRAVAALAPLGAGARKLAQLAQVLAQRTH